MAPCRLVVEQVPRSVRTIVVSEPERGIVLIRTEQMGPAVFPNFVMEEARKKPVEAAVELRRLLQRDARRGGVCGEMAE